MHVSKILVVLCKKITIVKTVTREMLFELLFFTKCYILLDYLTMEYV